MTSAQPLSGSSVESGPNANQRDSGVDGGNKLTVDEERGEDSVVDISSKHLTTATTDQDKGEEEDEEEEEEKAATLNEDSCTEIEEEEIVVQSFASLAGIEDEVNEDEIEPKVEIKGEVERIEREGNLSENLEIEEGNQNKGLEEGDETNIHSSTVNEHQKISSTNMIADITSERSDTNEQQENLLCQQEISLDDKDRETSLNKAEDETREVAIEETRGEQDATTTKQTPVEQQKQTRKVSKSREKSEENLPDDYKEALANVANEQRRLKEQLSIISASLPPSPTTPLSSATSLASSADLPADICVADSSNYEDEDEDEEGRNEREEEFEEEFEDDQEAGDREEEEKDFCAEAASTSTLRKLKMNTFKDIMVCERNRESMEAARRLFDELARNGPPKRLNGPKSRNDSLESSPDFNNRELSPSGSEELADQESYGTRIEPRSGSSISNSNSFRRTLVCSVSPINQPNQTDEASQYFESHTPYPIDGNEIKQCQTAFRENKRLIEEQQVRANKQISAVSEQRQQQSSCNDSIENGNNSCYNSGRWIRINREFLDQASQSKCSRCNRRLYPVDRMELDFTRTKLNIHRNCFKCQICSTLLR